MLEVSSLFLQGSRRMGDLNRLAGNFRLDDPVLVGRRSRRSLHRLDLLFCAMRGRYFPDQRILQRLAGPRWHINKRHVVTGAFLPREHPTTADRQFVGLLASLIASKPDAPYVASLRRLRLIWFW